MSMFSAAMIDPISIINCYKSCTIRKNYKTEQKTMSVTFIQFNHTHAIIVENKQSCVSAHGEHIPSNSAVAIFFFHTEFHHLFGRQLTRALDVIQSYVTGSDILVSESEAPVIQIKKSGFLSHFQLSHLPKTYIAIVT